MKAQIQHKDIGGTRFILQALVPFETLKNSVIFTYRTNNNQQIDSKNAQFEASKEYYQRRVDSRRSDEIKDFVRQSILLEREGRQMATLFPTSTILALEADTDNDDGNTMTIYNDDNCDLMIKTNVFIVDGQHRMMGLIKLFDEIDSKLIRTPDESYIYDYLLRYRLNCTILVNFDMWEQGQVFVNVNFKQKPVNRSLYYEIFGSEYRENEGDWTRNKIYLAHMIARKLNEHIESPFYQRVKMLGNGDGYVSQAFLVESVMRHFSPKGLWAFNPDQINTPDTGYFATEMLSFFVAVKRLFPTYWPAPHEKKGTLICKTTGVGAWVRLMGMVRREDDLQTISFLKHSASQDEICEEYIQDVMRQLHPLVARAEDLFGEKSSFVSSSGRGSEAKLFKMMVYILENANQDNVPNSIICGHHKDYYGEQVQEYIWTHSLDDLNVLGHHCDPLDMTDFHVNGYKDMNDALEIKATFKIYVTVYLDNEDETGFEFQFPADCICVFDKHGDEFVLSESDVDIVVNTDGYYR